MQTITQSITAKITAKGSDSAVPDNAGAVDADIFADGEHVGSVTLIPDHNGDLGSWGPSRDYWADDALCRWADDAGIDSDDLAREIAVAIGQG